MDYKLLGRSGLRVSDLFLGTMTFGETWGWGARPEECRKLLDLYEEAGGNVIDTAVNYTDGASETIVGELLGGGRRDRFVVATKYSLSTDPADPNASGNHRKNLTRSLETSLRRLRTDRVDLYWVHIWDPRTPIDETMRALDDAVRAGKVLYVGLSDMPAWVASRATTVAEMRGWTPAVAIQVPYNLAQRDAERDLLPMAGAFQMSVAAWSPLAGGLLSGKFTAGTAAADSRINAQAISERDMTIAQHVRRVAESIGATPSQVAIAWTMARHRNVHPIIGARRVTQLADNLHALDVLKGSLHEDALHDLEDVSEIDLGFPHDFIDNTSSFVYGEVGQRVQQRRTI